MDDGGSGTNDDRNRLAEVEGQLAELRAEVEQLRRDVRRLSGGTGELPDRGPQQGAGAQPNVVLTAFVSVERKPTPMRGGLPTSVERKPTPMRGGLPTVVRLKSTVVVTAPAELWREWETGVPPPGPLGDLACRLLDEVQEGVRERLAERLAELAIDPVWDRASTNWRVTDIGGFDAAARSFSDLDTWSHSIVASWVTQVSGAIGMPGAMANGAGAVIGLAVPLPFDQPLKELSQVIQVAGVAFGVVTGNAPLACASLKALAHDQLIDFVAKGIRDVASLRPLERAVVVIPPGAQSAKSGIPSYRAGSSDPVLPLSLGDPGLGGELAAWRIKGSGSSDPGQATASDSPVRPAAVQSSKPVRPSEPASPEEPVRPSEPPSPEEAEKPKPWKRGFQP